MYRVWYQVGLWRIRIVTSVADRRVTGCVPQEGGRGQRRSWRPTSTCISVMRLQLETRLPVRALSFSAHPQMAWAILTGSVASTPSRRVTHLTGVSEACGDAPERSLGRVGPPGCLFGQVAD